MDTTSLHTLRTPSVALLLTTGVLLALGWTLLSRHPSSAMPPLVSTRFLGYSNSSNRVSAVIMLSNECKHALMREPVVTIYWTQADGTPTNAPVGVASSRALLPGDCQTVALSPPTNGTWSASFGFTVQEAKEDSCLGRLMRGPSYAEGPSNDSGTVHVFLTAKIPPAGGAVRRE
jgi:hypothetical protein